MKAARTSVNRINREDTRLWVSSLAPVFAWIAAHQLNFLFSPWVCAAAWGGAVQPPQTRWSQH
jgi:hypothetical protein